MAVAAGVAGDGQRPVDELTDTARLCWHASRICRALRRALDELETALADAGQHADAIIELALEARPHLAGPRTPTSDV